MLMKVYKYGYLNYYYKIKVKFTQFENYIIKYYYRYVYCY